MPYNSPLLDKAKEESRKKRFSIPRRGRIRFVLLLLIAGGGFWWYTGHRQPATMQNTSLNDTTATEKKTTKTKRSNRKTRNKKSRKKAPVKRPKRLTFKSVGELLAKVPLRLSNVNDTVQFKNGAYRIRYSIDTSLQRVGKKFMRRYHPKYGAVVVFEPNTGRVISLISYTNDEEPTLGNNLFCRSMFPAASIFKTIAAAGAIEKAGIKAKTKLRTRGSNHTLYNSQLVKELKTYREVAFVEAYAYSINPVFGRIGLYSLGAEGLNEYALKFGFNADIPFELPNEKPVFVYPESTFAVAEVASGFNQSTTMSPLFGAMIAGGISNHGSMFAPTLVDSITDVATARNIYSKKLELWRVPVQKETADELFLLMKEVARFGTARKSFRYIKQSYRFKDIDFGGKTGSVDKEGLGKIDWFVGFCRHASDASQHISVGVVTVHGDYWTVHSSFIGAEMMRKHIRRIQIEREKSQKRISDSLHSVKKEISDSVYIAKKLK